MRQSAQAITLNWVSSTAVLAHLRTIARERLVDLLYAPTTDKRAPQCAPAIRLDIRTAHNQVDHLRPQHGWVWRGSDKAVLEALVRTELAATCSIAALALRTPAPNRTDHFDTLRSVFLTQSNRCRPLKEAKDDELSGISCSR